jgi:hypothetical protein
MMSVPGLLLVGLALCQTVALADTDTLVLNGVNGNSEGGVYTSPYQISVNGANQWLVCDDFETDISSGDSWTAEVNSLTSAENGDAKFTSSYSFRNTAYSLAEDYEAAALLAVQILQNPSDNSTTNEDYSYALWNIFDTQAPLPDASAGTYESEALAWAAGTGNLTGTPFAADASLVNDVVIYTPVYASGAVIPPAVPYPPGSQEFFSLDPVPEGSTVAFLLFDFLVALGAFFMLRKRLVRRSTARS